MSATLLRPAISILIALVAMLVAFGGPVLAQPDGKVFVCKYVGAPGEEVLQTGDNPISVSVNSIPEFKDFEGPIEDLVGEVFTDNQGPSLVLEVDIGQEEPAAECPAVLPPTGTIIVDKVVTGAGASTTEEFAINVTGQAGFMLSADDDPASFEVEAGAGFAVSETLTAAQMAAGWTLVSIVCTSDMLTGTLPPTFSVGDGETVTCIVTNAFTAPVVPELGSITIIKDADPNDAQDFAFSVTGTGLAAFSLDDDADGTLANQVTFIDLAAGAYTVTEATVTGWMLADLECSTGGAVDLTTATATITLAAGADVTCTFTNVPSEGELPGTPPPREGTLGGNPLPNTAMPMTGGSMPVLLGALLLVSGLGIGGFRAAVEARQRR